jgi:hypothetical protein
VTKVIAPRLACVQTFGGPERLGGHAALPQLYVPTTKLAFLLSVKSYERDAPEDQLLILALFSEVKHMGRLHFFELVASPEYITRVPATVDDEAPHVDAVGLVYHMRLPMKVSILTSNT